MARIDNEQYARLKEESLAHGYQVAVVQRWLLLPQSVDGLHPGRLDNADMLMRLPLPSGSTSGQKDARPYRNIYLTDAEYELITRAAMNKGIIRSTYVTRILEEQIRAADCLGWPLPKDITNESVDDEARRMLHKLMERRTTERCSNR